MLAAEQTGSVCLQQKLLPLLGKFNAVIIKVMILICVQFPSSKSSRSDGIL